MKKYANWHQTSDTCARTRKLASQWMGNWALKVLVASVLEAVDFKAASALPPKRSYFISSYPTHRFRCQNPACSRAERANKHLFMNVTSTVEQVVAISMSFSIKNTWNNSPPYTDQGFLEAVFFCSASSTGNFARGLQSKDRRAKCFCHERTHCSWTTCDELMLSIPENETSEGLHVG